MLCSGLPQILPKDLGRVEVVKDVATALYALVRSVESSTSSLIVPVTNPNTHFP